MKEKILNILGETKNTSYEIGDLSRKLEDSLGKINYEELNETLNKLVEEGKIYLSKKGKYMLMENSHLLQGKLQVVSKKDRTFGFVLLDTEDLYISSRNFNNAVDGDTVIAEVIDRKGNRIEGRIIKVLKRETEDLIGEITMVEGKPIITLDNKKLDYKVNLIKYPDNLVSGLKVSINLLKRVHNKEYDAEVIKVIGHKNEPGIDITLVAHEYKIPTEFPSEVKEEVKKIPGKLNDELLEKELEYRRDLTNEMIFTIDGSDTKDIDDAVSVKRLKNGNFELGVHIADVSYYVTEGSALKREAFNRGNSYYLADRVIPMLPVELSNGICSLNPGELRLAVSCVMEIDKNSGKILNYDVFKSVIKSNIQMTYEKVNKVLKQEYVEGYEKYKETLFLMEEVSTLLRVEKIKRGYIDFESDEIKLIMNEARKIERITKYDRGRGEEIIEDFMIAANESVAEYIYNLDLPFIYRVHDKPSEEKLKEFMSFISILGYTVNGKINYENIRNKDIQNIINQLKEKKEYKVISDRLLRSMSKAEYSPENIGHFGLGSKIYTHFTSPIRRYSDLIVHYLLTEYVFSGRINKDVVKKYQQQLSFITEHISQTERTADDCERAVNKMKIAEYMEDHIGEEFLATIDGLNNNGFFVETEELISGFVPVTLLKGYYTYREELMAMVGKANDMYRLGDKVKVRCRRASKEDREVDFEVVEKL